MVLFFLETYCTVLSTVLVEIYGTVWQLLELPVITLIECFHQGVGEEGEARWLGSGHVPRSQFQHWHLARAAGFHDKTGAFLACIMLI